MTDINEGSTFQITISFYDPDGVLQAPTAAQYSVHDLDSGTVLIAETELVPAGSVNLLLPPAASQIINVSSVRETHVITVSAQYGTTEEVNEEFSFTVRNLKFITT